MTAYIKGFSSIISHPRATRNGSCLKLYTRHYTTLYETIRTIRNYTTLYETIRTIRNYTKLYETIRNTIRNYTNYFFLIFFLILIYSKKGRGGEGRKGRRWLSLSPVDQWWKTFSFQKNLYFIYIIVANKGFFHLNFVLFLSLGF